MASVGGAGGLADSIAAFRNSKGAQNTKQLGRKDILVNLRFRAVDLLKVDFFSAPSGYLELHRQRENVFNMVHHTEVQAKTRTPSWAPFHVKLDKLRMNDDTSGEGQSIDQNSQHSDDLVRRIGHVQWTTDF